MCSVPIWTDVLNSMQLPCAANIPLQNFSLYSVNFSQQARNWNYRNFSNTQQTINNVQKQQAHEYLQQQISNLSSVQPVQGKNVSCGFGNIGDERKLHHTVSGAHSNVDLESQPCLQLSSNKNYFIPPVQCPLVDSAMETRNGQFFALGDGSIRENVIDHAVDSPFGVRNRMEMHRRMDDYSYSRSAPSDPPNYAFDPTHEAASSRTPPDDFARQLETGINEMTISMEKRPKSRTPPEGVEKAAIMHRHAASNHEAKFTWSGILPHRKCENPLYSNKVFLGGVPWDITKEGLQQAFSPFGNVRIEFPGSVTTPKHGRFGPNARGMADDTAHCFGYVYVIFDSDRQVKAMLRACREGELLKDANGGTNGDYYYYYQVSSKKMKSKEVQVIPWLLSDSNYVAGPYPYQKLSHENTIFVGALHGMLNAEGLAHIMQDLFGDVVYAGVDTDKHKYPIGSGRVTFIDHKSYMKAVTAAFVEIKTTKFVKKVQIDPYLEEMPCSCCSAAVGPYFCRNQGCFKYYCSSCWTKIHNGMDPCTGVHNPVMRNSKNGSCTSASRLLTGC